MLKGTAALFHLQGGAVSLDVSSIVSIGFSAGCVAVALAAFAMSGAPVSSADEGLRIVALETVFSGMHVSADQSRKLDDSRPAKPKPGEIVYPDALANAAVYRIIGAAQNEAERCASEDAFTRKTSSTRVVRFRLFRWPGEGEAGLLAVIQYSFLGVNPAMSCPSIGLLAHLVRNAEKWDARDEYLLDTTHHDSLQRIDVLDFAGDGANQLVIESSYGGAGMAASSLQVFDLRRGRFEELLNVDSRLQYWGENSYTQVLDLERTRQSHGEQFCFTKSTTFEQGEDPSNPRVTNPCYGIGEGVDFKAAADRNKMLAPLQ